MKPGKSADGRGSPKAGMLMSGGKSAATGSKGGAPKGKVGNTGAGLIGKPKAGK